MLSKFFFHTLEIFFSCTKFSLQSQDFFFCDYGKNFVGVRGETSFFNLN